MRLWDNAAALRRLYRGLYAIGLVCILASVAVWAVNSPYFPIKRVEVAGRLVRVNADDVAAVAKQYLHGNIFKADVNDTQKALAKLPWVANVQVKRLWPDAVEITIEERVPVARLSGSPKLVDKEGNSFIAPSDEVFPVLSVDRTDLIKNMVPQLSVFRQILEPTGLNISQLHCSDRLAWQIVLDNGIILHLGKDDAELRLRRFILAWHRVLKDNAAAVRYVDLRYRDGFAVRYKENNAHIAKTAAMVR
ncbi:cell division protein FtsQ/DivIB [Stenoxybacter acetivorans]|uniref:cell division protein FtsQ/DivIB n=1 Tax=Stenoxybacter acetivorans TaxID=422441 RepID=UPI000689DA4E|nr:FtsQ-type POTRA domain-containing protein [Stenoxybacter acetivorans]